MGTIIGSDGGNADVGSLIAGSYDSYNRELIFDLTLEAFSLYDMGHEGYPVLNDYVPVTDAFTTPTDMNVLNDAGDQVVDDSGNIVIATISGSTNRNLNPRKERIKYLTTTGTGWTLAEYKDYSFRDWVSLDEVGADFFSYLITGYDLGGDFLRKKQAPFLVVFCERTEQYYVLTGEGIVPDLPSSCIVQAQWDWNNSPSQGKWGTKFQAYRLLRPLKDTPQDGDVFDYGERVITTRSKLRGSGRALSLFIQSDTGKDLRLLGWGISFNKEQSI